MTVGNAAVHRSGGRSPTAVAQFDAILLERFSAKLWRIPCVLVLRCCRLSPGTTWITSSWAPTEIQGRHGGIGVVLIGLFCSHRDDLACVVCGGPMIRRLTQINGDASRGANTVLAQYQAKPSYLRGLCRGCGCRCGSGGESNAKGRPFTDGAIDPNAAMVLVDDFLASR